MLQEVRKRVFFYGRYTVSKMNYLTDWKKTIPAPPLSTFILFRTVHNVAAPLNTSKVFRHYKSDLCRYYFHIRP